MVDEGQDATQSEAIGGQSPTPPDPWSQTPAALPDQQNLPAQQGLPQQPYVPMGSTPPSYPPQPTNPPQPGYAPRSAHTQQGLRQQPGFGPRPGYPQQPGYPQPYPPAGYPQPYPPAGFGASPWGSAAAMAAFAPPGPRPGFIWGGIGVRFAAILIDAFLMLAVVVVAGVVALALSPNYDLTNNYSPAGYAIIWSWFAFFLLYVPFCWYLFGGTLGQKALGLRVVRAADGHSLDLGAVLIRYLVWAVCTGTIILGIVAAAMAADNPYKQTWPDDVSKSLVIRRA